MVVVAVIIAPFFAVIIIATRQAVGASSLVNVVLILLVGLIRQIRFGEIVDVAAFDLVGEAMLHGALIDGRAE
jgi:hypothetical protein